MRSHYLGLAALSAISSLAQPPVSIQLQLVNGGLTEPVALASAGDDRLFVVERVGRIQILEPTGNWAAAPFMNITSRVLSTDGEQGLLGLVFHPDYASNGYFYVNYVTGSGNGTTRISRFSVTADPNVADPNSEVILYSIAQPYTNHNGGDLHFGPDGYLYIALGDGGGAGDPQNRAQNLTVAFGKMLRINVNSGSPYSVPSSNPYFSTGGGVLPEIFMSGLRNPWRFGIDPVNGDIWIGDVGQAVWEEIDFWPGGDNSGPNFGWRCHEGNATYNTTGCGAIANYDFPVAVHAQSTGYCAIVGGRVYHGQNFQRLQGRYIYTDWCSGVFTSLAPNGAGGWVPGTMLSSGVMGYAAIGDAANGELYVCNQQNGDVMRIIDPYSLVRVSLKVFLEGPYDSGTDLQRDELRTGGHIPTVEPYSSAGYVQLGSGHESVAASVLAITGSNAIVDWVRIELRQSGSPATIAATANALVQRDGDVVATDGVSPVGLTVLPGNYYVAIRHRNHLGCMTAGTLALTATTTSIDLRSGTVPVYGTNARKSVGARQVLWAGNSMADATLKYTGTGNDRDLILTAIGGVVPTNSITGYHPADCNMDGTVKYTGTGNDRDPILINIGGTVPTNTRMEQLP